MTRIEKHFVNRKKQAEGNIKQIQQAFQFLELEKITTVLELGCGIGFVSTYLAETHRFDVFGTDYDVEQVQLASQLQPKIEHLHFQVQDATRLSFKDSRFDLVLSQNVFHHIPDWEAAIKEIARVLRSGGYFIWLDLTLPGILKKIFQPFVKNYGLYTFSDIDRAWVARGFKQLFHEHLAHGIMSQHHFVLQLN
jgi:SAM-dependent methyltransferase